MATLKGTTVNDTGFVKLPVGNTGQRTGNTAGDLRYNSDNSDTEIYSGANWVHVSKAYVTNGLVFNFDASDIPKTYNYPNMLGPYTWSLGSGGATNYPQNGRTNENERIWDNDPFGNRSIVWESRPTGDSGGDGGWNTGFYSTSRNQIFRSCIWVRRTSSSTGGTFYHGTNGGGQAVLRLDNGAAQGNPYWVCDNIGSLVQNEWFLHVSHVLPFTYTRGNVRHPDTGVYTIENGRVSYPSGCNVGQDMRNNASTTSLRQRVYHFYSTDSTSRLQWWGSRLERIDGNEASIPEILNNSVNKWYDRENGIEATIVNYPLYNSSDNSLDCSTTGTQYFTVPRGVVNGLSTWTVDMWISRTVTNAIDTVVSAGDQNNFLLYFSGNSNLIYENAGSSGSFSMNLGNNQIHNVTVTGGSGEITAYFDGSSVGTISVGTTISADGLYGLVFGQEYDNDGSAAFDVSQSFRGKWYAVKFYNRALSSAEVQKNFDAFKGRFGV